MAELYRTGMTLGSDTEHAVKDGKQMGVMVVAVCGEIVRSSRSIWDKSHPDACPGCVNPPVEESAEQLLGRMFPDDPLPQVYLIGYSPRDATDQEHAVLRTRLLAVDPAAPALCGIPARAASVVFSPESRNACPACVKALPP